MTAERTELIEGNTGLEKEGNDSVALVLLVLANYQNGSADTTPLVWTVIEKRSKEATGKKEGQISLPVETTKAGESTADNLIGSLSEFTADDPVIEKSLFYTLGKSVAKGALSFRGNPMDMAVIFYEGPLDADIQPLDAEELRPGGWRSLTNLRGEDPARLREEVIGAVLGFEEVTGFISGAFNDYRSGIYIKSPLKTLFPPGYTSLEDFIKQREMHEDVTIIPK